MKKYQKSLLLSVAVLGFCVLSAPVQADDEAAPRAGAVAVSVDGSIAAITYSRSEAQLPSVIYHAVWSDENGQDDLKWYRAVQDRAEIDLANHRGYGTYHVHTYQEKDGRMMGLQTSTFSLDSPNPSIETGFPEPGLMDIRISNLPSSMTKVAVPIWSDKNGQDDLHWYSAGRNPDGSYSLRVELRRHRFDTGTYHIHLYGESAVRPELSGLAGHSIQVEAASIPPAEEQRPRITVEQINPEEGTYTVRVTETPQSKPIKSVRVPIWSTANQSNLKWYEAVSQGDGSFAAQFDIRLHQALSGTYANHVYISYTDGQESSYAADSVSLSADQVRAKVAVKKSTAQHYEITVTDAYGGGDILLPTWSEVNGQDDLQWYAATNKGKGTYTFTVDTQRHAGSGLFQTHVYRRLNGQLTGLTSTSYQVEQSAVQSVSFQPNYTAANATTYPVGQCTWGAKALAPWAGNFWGNGGQWAASARAAGFRVGTTPEVGAIICWTDSGYGHVGVVTHVASSTRIQIQESNYAGKQYIDNFRGWFNPHAAGQGTVSYIYPK